VTSWLAALARCRSCDHDWRAVVDVHARTLTLECPRCLRMRGRVHYTCGAFPTADAAWKRIDSVSLPSRSRPGRFKQAALTALYRWLNREERKSAGGVTDRDAEVSS